MRKMTRTRACPAESTMPPQREFGPWLSPRRGGKWPGERPLPGPMKVARRPNWAIPSPVQRRSRRSTASWHCRLPGSPREQSATPPHVPPSRGGDLVHCLRSLPYCQLLVRRGPLPCPYPCVFSTWFAWFIVMITGLFVPGSELGVRTMKLT